MISLQGRRSPFSFWPALAAGALFFASPAAVRADEFSPVPKGDVIYAHLATVAKAGWAGRDAAPKTPARDLALTRYEAALETARALLAVGAQARGDEDWKRLAPRPALRALRALTLALRPELGQLDVDVRQSLALLDGLLQVKTAQPEAPAQAVRPGVSLSAPVQSEIPSLSPSWLAARQAAAGEAAAPRILGMNLSQRLRVSTAVEMLARDADDLFGTTRFLPPSGPKGARPRTSAGAALSLTDSLTLRATYENQPLEPQPASPFASRDLLANAFGTGGTARALGGGVDIAPVRGVRLSGDVASVQASESGQDARATRLSGGLALSAWQNRLSLSANLSRLVPEDSLALAASTSTRFDLGLDVTERLRFNLLYQQLFSPDAPVSRDSFVGGGIKISF